MYDSCNIINSLFRVFPQKKNDEIFLPIGFIDKVVEKERKIEYEYYKLLNEKLFTDFNLDLDDWNKLSIKNK